MKSFFTFLQLLPFMVMAQQNPQAGLNIFTLGDSNGTFPYSWTQQLKTLIPGAVLVNVSKSGKTIGFVNNGDSSLNQLLTLDKDLRRAATATGPRSFDYVVIGLGTNDAKAVFAAQQEQVVTHLETLIKRIKSSSYPVISGAKIVIISPPPYGIKADTVAKYAGGRQRVENMSRSFKTVALKYKCLFVDGYSALSPFIETMSADGLHMNEEGQRKLAEQVTKLIKR